MRSARLTAGILGLVAMLSLPGPAPAQEEDSEELSYDRDGWYLGLNYNYGYEDWEVGSGETVGDSQGLSAYVGWRFLRYLGLDVQYEWQNEFKTTTALGSGGANANVFTLNGRAYLPFGRFQPFVLAGMGWFQTSRTDGSTKFAKGDFVGRYGGGLDVHITKNWVFEGSAIYVNPTGEQNDQSYVSFGAGLQYRFNPHVY